MKVCVFFSVFLAVFAAICQPGHTRTIDRDSYQTDADGKERWNYVNVRPGAHMFWWLYFSQAANKETTPLIIWLQGGPGGSSTGFGNFEELGPLDGNLKPRSTTWLSVAHLLFIDNPVGTGYSYVDSEDAYTTDVAQISADLLAVMSEFIKQSPEFESTPLYIFSESYGGKMTAAFSKVLYEAIQGGKIKLNFRGLAMGDSWISPMDYVFTWGPYLYATSLVDEAEMSSINATAMKCKKAYDKGEFAMATSFWSDTEKVCDTVTGGVNFYNILKWGGDSETVKKEAKRDPNTLYYGWPKEDPSPVERLFNRHVKPMLGESLDTLMNGQIRKKLGIIPANVTWGAQSGRVFDKQTTDFMKPVISTVDDLLKNTDLQVVVYNGQLDLICDTLGTERWVQKLTWDGLPDYNKANRKPIKDKHGIVVMYEKSHKNFHFYWVLEAGHMVPADQGVSALSMVDMILHNTSHGNNE